MGLIAWASKRIKNLNAWYIGALKICCIIIGMLVGAFIPDFIRRYLWWFLGLAIVLTVWLSVRFITGRQDGGAQP